MRFKAGLVFGFAAGYVLGSRAGRERYEQLARAAKSISNNPSVKQTTQTMQAQAAHLGSFAKQTMQDKAGAISHDMMAKVSSKLPSSVSSRLGRHDVSAEPVHADGSMT